MGILERTDTAGLGANLLCWGSQNAAACKGMLKLQHFQEDSWGFGSTSCSSCVRAGMGLSTLTETKKPKSFLHLHFYPTRQHGCSLASGMAPTRLWQCPLSQRWQLLHKPMYLSPSWPQSPNWKTNCIQRLSPVNSWMLSWTCNSKSLFCSALSC